jgi:hypothetical protein
VVSEDSASPLVWTIDILPDHKGDSVRFSTVVDGKGYGLTARGRLIKILDKMPRYTIGREAKSIT